MASSVRLLGVFLAIVGLAVVGAVALSAGGGAGAGAADGERISGQSPASFQPENVNQEFDPEEGTIGIDAGADDKRILVDTAHGNEVSESNLEPLAEAMFSAGHSLDFGASSGSSSPVRGGSDDYSATLQNYDGVIIAQPTQEFSHNETEALQEYAEAGGRVVVLAEPSQIQGGGTGLFASPSLVSFGANNMTRQFGVQIGSEMLYNLDDANNDNNFKSIYASPSGDGPLTEGVETISLDLSGYAVVGNTGAVDVLYTANEGTRTLDTRREGQYPVVARNDNMVFVSDTSFLLPSEIYDVDNEVFVGNLAEFLVSGDLDPAYGPEETSGPPREPPEPPTAPTPAGPEGPGAPQPTPTPGNATAG
jgi:hypothetical protein